MITIASKHRQLPAGACARSQRVFRARVRNAYASEAPAPLKRAREQRLIAYDVALTRFIRSTQQ